MSWGRASEKAPQTPLAMGLPAGGLKGGQDLDNGRPRERAPAPLWGWIQTKGMREGGGGRGSGTHSPLVPSTGSSQGHLQTLGDKQYGRWGVWWGWRGNCQLGSSERQEREVGERSVLS